MFNFVNYMRSLVNYAIFGELCDRMRLEVDCAKSHHRVISEGLALRGVEVKDVLTGVSTHALKLDKAGILILCNLMNRGVTRNLT